MAPQNATVPPSLPPSVEEAYRRKCVQLKNRTLEVEDSNDAARLRLTRVKRQVEKLRIERAFLLEQLAKRTSANVEDSEGSPSPPPTPKEKPLRTKRGHRKGDDGKAGDSQGPGSPTQPTGRKKTTNGVDKAAESAFDIFAAEQKTKLEDKELEGSVDDEISRLWSELSDKDKEPYEEKAAAAAADSKKSKETEKADDAEKKEGSKSAEPVKKESQDEDVEMTNYDTEEQETQDKDGDD